MGLTLKARPRPSGFTAAVRRLCGGIRHKGLINKDNSGGFDTFVEAMRRFLLILMLMAAAWDVRSEPGMTGAEPRTPRFVNYGAAEGLPSSAVYAIAQDADGALWVGTRGGLSRFDGVRFETVIPDKRVTSLAVDQKNRVWVGSTTGMEILRFAQNNKPQNDTPPVRQEGPKGNIRALLCDSDGFVWATVGDSLLIKFSYHPSEGIREEERTAYNKRWHEGDYPYFQIYEDSRGTLWLGGRLVRTQFIEDRSHPQSQFRFNEHHCTGSYAEVNGTLYAFGDGDNSLNTFAEARPLSHGRVPIAHARLLVDHKGRLWAAGSYGLGLVNLERPEETVVYRHEADNPAAIASAELYCIFEDRQGNIWVGGDNGLSVLSQALQQVEVLNLPSKQITALLQASDGRLWVGTADDGAYADGIHVDYRPAGRPNEGHVSCLYEDSEGSVYIGLYAGCGFNVWKNGRVSRGALSGPLPGQQDVVAWEDRSNYNWITDFLEASDGRFYVVTWEGVGINEWDRRSGKTLPAEWLSPFPYPLPHLDSAIYLSSRLGSRLIEDAEGNLIYGTTEAGLNIIDHHTREVTKYYKGNSSIPDDCVTDLCITPDGTLWAATHAGLWSAGRQTLLPGKMVQSVLSDARGRLWAGTEDGLWFVDTDGSVGVARKALGFPSDIYGERTACKLSDGRLAFGGPEGAAIFHPDSLLSLKASNHLLLGSLVQHRYRLNGGEWAPGHFTGLPDHIRSGRYILEEQSSDIFGRWERGETAVRTLRVPWPLWLRWPILLLYGLVLAAAIWTLLRLRERRLLEKELDMRNRLFSIISHDLRNPIQGNRLLTHQLLEQVDKLSREQMKGGLEALAYSVDNSSALLENLLLWSLNQKGMLEPVIREENLLALATEAIQSVRENEIIALEIPQNLTVRTDRNMLLTSLRNLLDNAVKASPEGGKVLLHACGNRISILDQGPGMQEATAEWGHGLGLVITRELLEKMGASMHAENRPEGGLQITILL